MRKYLSNILFALVAVFAAGCVEVDIYPVEPQTPATVTLQLRNTDLVATRVDVTDDSQCNEDLIENVQCFFTNSTNTDQIIYRSGKIELAENTKGSATITLQDIPANILPSMSKVYVVANYADDLTAETSIAAIKAKGITLGTGATQDSFVMDGTSNLTLSGTTISGRVDLERVAAKIVVKANINTSIEEGGVTWTPVPSGIKMTYKGGIVASKISAQTAANTVKTDGYTQAPVTGENPSTVFTQDTENSTDAKYVGYQTVPFYSFPVVAGTEPEGEITMTIPWTTGTGDNAVTIEYAYEIPVKIAYERNKVYIIDIDVEVLGNLEGKELTPSYIVLNWKDTPINASLSKPQYLVVDQNYVVMNNVETISINYQSSDPVTVERSKDGNYAVYSSYEVTAGNGVITLTHNLDNEHDNTDKTYDYLPQTFTVTIYHTNNPNIRETITIVQYPAMYVTSKAMTKSTVFVNGNNSRSQGWWWVRGSASASANMYTVTVSSFDATTAEYIIADPREPANTNNFVFRDNINANSSVRTTATDASGDNTLTGYRGAITGAASEHLVAPQMLFSSSYISNRDNNVNTYNYTTNGKYRCAGYQEDGYPAGRWRLPTPAEILYVGRLGAEGKVEGIFVNNVVYLSSNGGYRYSESNGGSVTREGDTSATLRCVYDLWYWKDKCKDVNQFIWGAEGDIAGGAKSAYLVSVE